MKTFKTGGKLLPLILAFFISILILSCKKQDPGADFPDPDTLPQGLIGSWVETTTLSDTMIFHSDKDTSFFWLHRGYEIRNGYLLPVIGSGGYFYTMCADSINVAEAWSESMTNDNYCFNFDKPNLTIRIGNFCKYLGTKKSILTFRKIK
jgi:hypothetical protein